MLSSVNLKCAALLRWLRLATPEEKVPSYCVARLQIRRQIMGKIKNQNVTNQLL